MFRRAIVVASAQSTHFTHLRTVANVSARFVHSKGNKTSAADAKAKLICEAPVEYTTKRTFFGGRATAVIPSYQVSINE